jgi:hypothetical protein
MGALSFLYSASKGHWVDNRGFAMEVKSFEFILLTSLLAILLLTLLQAATTLQL